MLRKYLLSLLLSGVLSTVVGSPYYFSHYQVSDGLSNNAVLCSVQDKNGFIWFGTRDGLNRFDGYHFKNFIHDPGNLKSLGSNLIHTLMVRDTNEIWIGTDQGIYIYHPKTDEFVPFKYIEGGESLQITEDKTGNVWFISDNKLYKYSENLKRLDLGFAAHHHQNTYAFCIDHNNEVWMGMGNGIRLVQQEVEYKLPHSYDDIGRIEKIFVDASNNIWIGTSRTGVYKWNRNTAEIQHIIKPDGRSPLYIRDIEQVTQNKLWVATESGLIIYDQVSQVSYHITHQKDDPWSLSDNAVYSILRDHQDGVWVSTFFGGINYYHPQHNLFEKIFPRNSPNSIQGHAVREMVEDNHQNIWIGTEDHGLTRFSTQTKKFYTLGDESGLDHNNIHGLLLTGDSLLVGTFLQGLYIVNAHTNKVIKNYTSENTDGTLGNNFIYHIYKTSTGKILLATSPGIYEFIPGKNIFLPFRAVPLHIFYTAMYEDDQHNLWLTTWRDGLYRIDAKTNKYEVFLHDPKDESTLNSNRVNRVLQGSNGRIWVATEGGLALYDKQFNAFRRFTIKDGLPSNLILAFQEDDSGNLWISTTKGLVKMCTSTYRMKTYTLQHGLLDLQFNYNSVFKDSKGLFYFGAFKGLIRFDPLAFSDQKYRTNNHTPIYITSVYVNQKELTVDDSPVLSESIVYTNRIKLKHDESSITINFVALNFASAKSTSYKYRLVGLDTTWTYLRENTPANFAKLPPGKYTFQVMAADPAKEPISMVKSLEIVILPPYWASTTAYICYCLLLLSTISYTLYNYDKKIKDKNRHRLEEIKAHREKELYKTKMDFFMQVTHDIKTPLTLIKAPLEKIIEGNSPDKTDRWLDIIHQNTEKLLSLTDQLLDFRKMESNQFSLKLKTHSISKLVSTCIQDFSPLVENKNIRLEKSIEQNVEAEIDIETIYKIVSNMLSNAIKYAENTVYVHVYKNPDQTTFSIEVKNDGILLSDEEIRQIFEPFQRASSHYRVKGSGLGLALASSFAMLHGGTLTYRKNIEKLNIFVLEIPI